MKKYILAIIITMIFAAAIIFTVTKNNTDLEKITAEKQVSRTMVSKRHTEGRSHEDDIRGINEAWDNITEGNLYFQAGRFDAASVAYKKAYGASRSSKGVSGIKLAETYEKLNQLDDALVILNELDGEIFYGKHVEANKMRARLLTAKAQQGSAS